MLWYRAITSSGTKELLWYRVKHPVTKIEVFSLGFAASVAKHELIVHSTRYYEPFFQWSILPGTISLFSSIVDKHGTGMGGEYYEQA